ncbi:uncharacterized protein BP5553_03223 [Venustampulla echinocandica]|uniref:Serine hydrolase domain-containing protein n=1 Tax=Venustampulla echinocandica TaxID=2656787 RepID=A0A370TTP2_9HELO|nr:uncharacterized protein BP5553_03223 [Venustampulla echinocandica]RDL38883.1 hypothetical protein BP5553_03223 [Venustampulla echinocandica]
MAPLPRIACFHGGGSSSAIFAVQAAQLEREIHQEFELVFFDGPFLSGPGPGVLPAFDSELYQPYRTWFKRDEKVEGWADIAPDGSGFDGKIGGKDGVERVWELMKKAGGKGKGEWVAAMGFSQGTRVVGGLLLDQQRRREKGLLKDDDIVLKFGILCMGSFAPMISAVSRDADKLDLIRIPTLHLHGTKDDNYVNGKKQLATYYDPQTAKGLEIEYHHAMPWNRDDLLGFAKLIRQMWKGVQESGI